MMRSALIALVAVSAVASTSVASVPSKVENRASIALATDQPVPLKVNKNEKRNFALSMNTKSAKPVKVVRAKATKIKIGKSNAQIKAEKAERERAARLASQRKSNFVPVPTGGTIPSDATYKKWIEAAAAKYGVSNQAYILYRVMMGESRGNPYAQNRTSGASGLFQFMPSTWRGTPYGHLSIWDAKAQCYAAAWMFSQGRQREWCVYKMLYG